MPNYVGTGKIMTPDEASELMSDQQILDRNICEYEALLEARDKTKMYLQELDDRLEAKKDLVCTLVMDIEDRFGVQITASSKDFKYTVGRKTYYSVPAGEKDAVVRSLRSLGWQDLVQTRVDPRTLTKALTEVTDADGTLPKRYRNLLDHLGTFDKNTLTRRKK